jgi:hypothetical protein
MPSTLFLRRRGAFWGWRELYASFAGFRKPNRNGLLSILNSVLPFPNMMNLFANEFPRLGGWRLAFASILAGAFNGLFFRHSTLLQNSPFGQSSQRGLENLSGKGCKTAKIFRPNSLGVLLTIGCCRGLRDALTNLLQDRAI